MKKLLAIGLAFYGQLIFAESYVVTFKISPDSATKLAKAVGPNEFTKVLKDINSQPLQQLESWLQQEAIQTKSPVELWLVTGAVVKINEQEAAKLAQAEFVESVYKDEQRKFIQPQADLNVRNQFDQTALWGLDKIGLKELRAKYPELDGRGIRVGIIDTGIQSRHPELDRVQSVTFKDFVVGLPNPYDDHGHGTHVAGTIAGIRTGVAPRVSLVVAKGLSGGGWGTLEWLVGAMQWMTDPDGNPNTNDRVHLVSNSWGAGLWRVVNDLGIFAVFNVAVENWVKAGIVPVFAAGNSGEAPNGVPGGLPDSIAVGAINSASDVSWFSSRGPNIWIMDKGRTINVSKPDIAAPGERVLSAFPGNKYATWSGTSMATPHVSGSIALLLQKYPTLSVSQVRARLYGSPHNLVFDNVFGAGVLNLLNLVK